MSNVYPLKTKFSPHHIQSPYPISVISGCERF